MVQIVKKKKKGRPSKSDLARRSSAERAQPERDLRRSHRRRSLRYNIDYDDYVDDDEEEEEDEQRREKKLKLVLKLPHSESAGESEPSRPRRDGNDSGMSSSEYGNKPPKKRRIGGEDDDDDGDGDNDYEVNVCMDLGAGEMQSERTERKRVLDSEYWVFHREGEVSSSAEITEIFVIGPDLYNALSFSL